MADPGSPARALRDAHVAVVQATLDLAAAERQRDIALAEYQLRRDQEFSRLRHQRELERLERRRQALLENREVPLEELDGPLVPEGQATLPPFDPAPHDRKIDEVRGRLAEAEAHLKKLQEGA